jgi:ABC-type glycerol-3-phosphate transport system permease component
MCSAGALRGDPASTTATRRRALPRTSAALKPAVAHAAALSSATGSRTTTVVSVPQDLIDAARVDGAGRIEVLLRIVVPIARPGIAAVAVLVAVFTWNDFGGAPVLIQQPDSFTAQLALTTFSTFYATDQGLTFAGMAIVIVPPLVLFVILQRSFIQGLTMGATRH